MMTDRRRKPPVPLTDEQSAFAGANYGLVHAAIKLHKPYGMRYDDAASAANWAYLRAVKKFNPARKVQFSTFANFCIHREIWRAYLKRRREFQNHREQDEDPRLSCGPAHVIEVDDKDELPQLRKRAAAAFAILSEREKHVVMSRLGMAGQPMRLQQIADHLGITKECVRQIMLKAVKRMRAACQLAPGSPRTTRSQNA